MSLTSTSSSSCAAAGGLSAALVSTAFLLLRPALREEPGASRSVEQTWLPDVHAVATATTGVCAALSPLWSPLQVWMQVCKCELGVGNLGEGGNLREQGNVWLTQTLPAGKRSNTWMDIAPTAHAELLRTPAGFL